MRRWSARIMIGLVGAAFLFLAWSLVYAVVVGWRFDPRLPSEGAARWALLQSLNADYSWQVLFRSADHFSRRMLFPPTQAETAIRGAIALSVVLAAGLGLAIAAHVLRPLKPYGEARFGSILDAERRKLTTRRGLVLGRLAGATITSDEPGHVLVVGPTRSGKGQSFIGPNGLLWNGSAVVFDPKKENVAIFGAYRAAAGDKVYLFNPGELRSHRYNPLDFIRRDETMPTDALVVAGFIVPDTPGEVWGKSARLLLAAMIGYVLTSPLCEGARHLRSVARMLVSGKDISAHLKSIVATEGERLPSWVIDAFNQYVALEPETRNSAVFNLNIALNPWNNRLVAAATATSDFDIRELRKKRMSIFIGCSVAQLDAFRPLLNILVQQIHDVLMMAPPKKDEPHQVLLLIDEFRQLGAWTISSPSSPSTRATASAWWSCCRTWPSSTRSTAGPCARRSSRPAPRSSISASTTSTPPNTSPRCWARPRSSSSAPRSGAAASSVRKPSTPTTTPCRCARLSSSGRWTRARSSCWRQAPRPSSSSA